MSYDAKVFNVMIASPGDVTEERKIAREVIYEWNTLHSDSRGIVLLPIGWETHSSPEMGDTAQDIINRQVLDKCDLLVGIFWARIGTSTRDHASGTVEEIGKHVESGRPAMLYFSDQPVHLESVDHDQYRKLREFKASCERQGLIQTYDTLSDFRDKFNRELQLKIDKHQYFHAPDWEEGIQPIIFSKSTSTPHLSDNARVLLKEASLDDQGTILHLRTLGETSIRTNNKNLIASNERREVAKWEAALRELLEADLIEDRGSGGEIFQLTAKGYKVADVIPARGTPRGS